mgnify:CR=1 FL=1
MGKGQNKEVAPCACVGAFLALFFTLGANKVTYTVQSNALHAICDTHSMCVHTKKARVIIIHKRRVIYAWAQLVGRQPRPGLPVAAPFPKHPSRPPPYVK